MTPEISYTINKGIGRPILFKGLKSQYIWYVAVLAIGLLLLSALLYGIGIPTYWCLGIVVALGFPGILGIYHLSDRYGEHGLTRHLARRRLPKYVKVASRKLFTQHGKDLA